MRLQKLAERIYPESQCGFRAGWSTIDMIFSLRQLQEKCREQHMPVYIAFIDLTKAFPSHHCGPSLCIMYFHVFMDQIKFVLLLLIFDLVSRDGLFKVLPKIGCPPKLQSMIAYFHTDTKGTVQFNGSFSEPFENRSGVKQGCSNAIWHFLWPVDKTCIRHNNRRNLPSYPIRWQALQPRPLRAKTKVRELLIRDMLFADDAEVVAHTQEELQSLMDCFSQASKDFGLTISLKKTNVLGQDTEAPPVITIDDYELGDVCQFTYLGSTITDNLSLDAEINKRIGKAASTLALLTARVWTSPKLSAKTKMTVYNACVISTLLYGSETWTTLCRAREKAQHIPPEKHPPYPGNMLAG